MRKREFDQFDPFRSDNVTASRYSQSSPLRASLAAGDYAQGDAEYEVLAAEVEHNPSLSEDTLILPPEEQEYLQKSKQFRQDHMELSELSRRAQKPIRADKLSKRSLELFNLRSQEYSLEQKVNSTTKRKKKSNRSPVYFFQPNQKKSEPSEDKAQSIVRNRARSQEMETLLKGFENILKDEEEKSVGVYESKESKPGVIHASPIKEDPLELRQTISRVESEEGLCFRAHLSDGEDQGERPTTPDNTPLTSQFDKFGSPQFFKQRSDAQRRKVRGFFRNPSRSSSTSKLPFEADSKNSSDHVAQNEDQRPAKSRGKLEKGESTKQETKERPPVLQMLEPQSGQTRSNAGISESLLALQKQKQRILLKPTYFNVMVVGESGIGKTTFIEQFMRVGCFVSLEILPTTVPNIRR